jgi:hypothetical protein
MYAGGKPFVSGRRYSEQHEKSLSCIIGVQPDSGQS